MMPLRYREDRATQAAARFLRLRGGRMSYLKLIKLLYLADRRALVELGRPITFDRYVSMPHGPVLSRTYDLIVADRDPEQTSYWYGYISAPKGYDVKLEKEAPNDQLSPAEEAILDAVFSQFGKMSRWDLRDYTHTLPEWQDPHGSSVPIDLRDVLLTEGMTDGEAAAVEEALDGEDSLERLLG